MIRGPHQDIVPSFAEYFDDIEKQETTSSTSK